MQDLKKMIRVCYRAIVNCADEKGGMQHER